MGTIYIDKRDCQIKLDGETLAFYSREGREGAAPVHPVKRIIVIGKNMIDTAVVHRMAKKGGTILFLSGKRLHFRGILYGRLHNNGMLRVKQYEMSLNKDFLTEYSKDLINKKINGQLMLLNKFAEIKPQIRIHLNRAIEILEGILQEIQNRANTIDILRGFEGSASNAYFSAYCRMFPDSLGFRGRNKRPPKDPVNAMLSLCYTLIYYEISTEIYIVGLDPTIGFYHQFEYGRDSLSCDIEEPFRPMVDEFVWHLFKERIFSARDFNEQKNGVFMKKKARARFYPIYEKWAQDMRKKIEIELRGLVRRLTDGQNSLSK